jgi:uncharacterized protein
MTEPLTDPEFESLGDVLKRFGSKRAMNIEQLDGFVAAVICCPSDIPQSEYLPEIWGDAMVNEYGFAAQPVLQKFLSLVERHRRAVSYILESGDVFTPVLLADHDGGFLGNDWANGFVRGMNLRKGEWSTLLNDDNHGGSIVPIFALAHEHDPDPKMRPYKEPITMEQREKLIIGAAAGVMNIYKYFRRRYLSPMVFVPASSTYRRITPKTGRNELCPCGSGKKFKHCCGRITLH